MNSRERITRMFEHREADQLPILDTPWAGTISRRKREGIPADSDWRDYFGVDKYERIRADITPRYTSKILEETDRYTIDTSPWGVTMKQFKEQDATPEFLDFTITTQAKWEEAKQRMLVGTDRIPWEMLKQNYARWKGEGRWIQALFGLALM